jgi:hypothetical protein|tara:strand:- start:3071 stop:3385 length:315 start_codon:yes stop_codon:yes gene_type:complete
MYVKVTLTVTRPTVFEVEVGQEQVVQGLGLEGEDRAHWRSYVEELIDADPEAFLNNARAEPTTSIIDADTETIDSITVDDEVHGDDRMPEYVAIFSATRASRSR